MKELYRQATEIFLEVCNLEPKQQLARLNILCQDNSVLRTRVEQMLLQDQTSRLVSNDQHDLQAVVGLIEPEDSSSSAPHPPEIQGYQIVRFLGQGGMGIVWQALQTSTRREVALKVLPADTTTNQKAHRRFEREIELAARLDHPNIARITKAAFARIRVTTPWNTLMVPIWRLSMNIQNSISDKLST